MTDTHTDTESHTGTGSSSRRPMGVEMWSFLLLALFFVPVTLIYAFWSNFEPVGTVALGLLVAMWAMVGFFLGLQSRKVHARPEDDPAATVEDHPTSDYGHFAPFSWWPFVLGIGVTLAAVGLALGWWIFGLGGAVTVVGLVGHLYEFNRGPHAH